MPWGGSSGAPRSESGIGARVFQLMGKQEMWNVKCKYCEKVLMGGIYQLKHHLIGTSEDVGACIEVLEC